jgi:hypothetical protein
LDQSAEAFHNFPEINLRMTETVTTPNTSLLAEGESLQDIPVTPIKEISPLDSPTSEYICQPGDEQQSSSAPAADKSESLPQQLNVPSSSSAHPALEFVEEEGNPEELEIGDHVYQWRSWGGVPGVFQHHGIVMDVIKDDEDKVVKLTIADFSNVEQKDKKEKESKDTKRRSGLFQEGILRTYTDTDKWHKVLYEAKWWKRQVFRAGTCTSFKADAVGLVLARVNFITQFPEILPDYHVVYSNCECVAFWCKTGQWCTLQASSFLELTAAGQVKSSATLAATAATTQVSVPAAGKKKNGNN